MDPPQLFISPISLFSLSAPIQSSFALSSLWNSWKTSASICVSCSLEWTRANCHQPSSLGGVCVTEQLNEHRRWSRPGLKKGGKEASWSSHETGDAPTEFNTQSLHHLFPSPFNSPPWWVSPTPTDFNAHLLYIPCEPALCPSPSLLHPF